MVSRVLKSAFPEKAEKIDVARDPVFGFRQAEDPVPAIGKAGGVRQQVADGDILVREIRKEPCDFVIQGEEASFPEEHHRRRREGFTDGTDIEKGVFPQRNPILRISHADSAFGNNFPFSANSQVPVKVPLLCASQTRVSISRFLFMTALPNVFRQLTAYHSEARGARRDAEQSPPFLYSRPSAASISSTRASRSNIAWE